MSINHIILNGTVITQGEYNEELCVFYEVVRVKNRALMFLEDHIIRLNHSLMLAGIDLTITVENVKSDLAKLFSVDGIRNQNVKYAVSVQDDLLTTALYYTKSTYPDMDAYKKGVSVKTVSFEREHPEIKQLTTGMQAIRESLLEDDAYEYLLVDHEDTILEGTRTNVFFVKDGRVITADTHKVLGGITRHHVADLARRDYRLLESALPIKDLSQVEAVFLTGTSIGVLPVSRVDDMPYDSACHPVVLSLKEAYEKCAQDYILSHQLPND